jgi:hypothetical protein
MKMIRLMHVYVPSMRDGPIVVVRCSGFSIAFRYMYAIGV